MKVVKLVEEPSKNSSRHLNTAQVEHEPSQESVSKYNAEQDANPFSSLADLVPIVVENAGALNQTLIGQRRIVETAAASSGVSAGVVARSKLVNHHPLKHVALVVNIVKDVAPEGVQLLRWHEETTRAHPQTVRKRGRCERDDEDGHERSDEYDQ